MLCVAWRYPSYQYMGKDSDITHSCTCHILYNHTPQSSDYPTCAVRIKMPKGNIYHNKYSRKYDNQLNDHQHKIMMKDCYRHNRNKMTPADNRELKSKTFPYLSNDDICLNMSDRDIVRKELDLETDSVLNDNDKQSIKDFYYSMRECLSTHDNPIVQNKWYVSLKPINLKPFYIKPYLTHEF